MGVTFVSSHPTSNFSSGRLTVAIGVEDEASGQTAWDEIYFEVPSDFRAHNDAVAAALMTLVGREHSEVNFNFPISTYCAEALRGYYGEIAFSPVDPAAAPRRKGSRIGVNFSGGMDSVGAWLLLREIYGEDFVVITSEYGGFFEFERQGYGNYRRDVSCQTNLRLRRFDRVGRFNFCVPLLFAEYLDLGGIVTGHGLLHSVHGLADDRGRQPGFLHGDLVVNAGGVDDIHLLRSITSTGVAMAIMALGSDRIAAALAASTPPNSFKQYSGALFFRILHAEAGLPIPEFLLEYKPPKVPAQSMGEHAVRMLYLIKRLGIAEAGKLNKGYAAQDVSFLDNMSLDFLCRYNTRLVELLPEPLRGRAVAAFHACRIGPYDERDWEEIGIIRRFFKQHIPRYQFLDD